jgi:hypothetical protein
MKGSEWSEMTFGSIVNRSKVLSVSIRSSKSESGAKAVLGVEVPGVAVIVGTVTVGLL